MKKDSTIKFIGLDVHSKTISVVIADEGRKGEVRHYGTIENTFEAIDKVIKTVAATETELKFIYEAGPCGFCAISLSYRQWLQVYYHSTWLDPQAQRCSYKE